MCKENRTSNGWLTIIETMRNWDDGPLDYILAYRRGGGIFLTLYDGYLRPVVTFPVDGYVAHADLTASGREQVIIYSHDEACVFGWQAQSLSVRPPATGPLRQSKRLYSSTLYPGGEY